MEQNGGHGLVALYGGFACNVILQNFKDFHWKAWKFEQIPPGYWVDVKNQKVHIQYLLVLK